MLRRAPTALTITPTDIADFETLYTRRLAHLQFLKTGEDPHGLFAHLPHPQSHDPDFVRKQMQFEQQRRLVEMQAAGDETAATAATTTATGGGGGMGVVDPSDELKPLPGDKARIVRGREERIVGRDGGGVGGGGGGGGGGSSSRGA